MKVAYIDHSFHQHTHSTQFAIELLQEYFEVECFWDDSWQNGLVAHSLVSALSKFEPDVIVFFQVLWSPRLLKRLGIHSAVFIPMYDGCHRMSVRDWRRYESYPFLSFSSTLARKLELAGLQTLAATYYPDVVGKVRKTSDANKSLAGFFWYRTPKVSWKIVEKLASSSQWSEIYLHNAPDPGAPTISLDEVEGGGLPVEIGTWFDDREQFAEKVGSSDVFFAPRLLEGIGMGFLEAMSLGCCVVAPDLPTHNEYIEDGLNGLLYDPTRPESIDFSGAIAIGDRAAEDVRAGRERWKNQIGEIISFVERQAGKNDFEEMKRFVEVASRSERALKVKDHIILRALRHFLNMLPFTS